jgi:hypothetical protein
MSIGAKIDFIITTREEDRFIRWAKEQIIEQMYIRILNNISNLKKIIQLNVNNFMKNSAEVKALSSSTHIRGMLGLKDHEADSVIEEIIKLISEDVVLDPIKHRDYITLQLKLINSNYSKILALPGAKFVSIGKSKELITWLEWLLLKGNQVIFGEYSVQYGNYNSKAFSRSGEAIMVKTGSFRIPPAWSGTATNNFIVRALSGIEKIINTEVGKIIQ